MRQHRRIIEALQVSIIDADGIYPMAPQLRGQIGIDVFVNENGYFNGGTRPLR